VLHAGIATHICHSEKLPELEAALLSEKDVSGVLDSFQSKDLAKQPFSLQSKLQQINQVFAPETVEEILQKLSADGSDWAKKTTETLHKMSPTSLKITMKQLRLGKELNLQQCLQMEIRMTQRCCSGHDFIEGNLWLNNVQLHILKESVLQKNGPNIFNKLSSSLRQIH
jgi:3-hydroxyisobutyryl-CoA hydrolase